jgi:hypothetical protein
MVKETHPEILADLQVFGSPEYEKVAYGMAPFFPYLWKCMGASTRGCISFMFDV